MTSRNLRTDEGPSEYESIYNEMFYANTRKAERRNRFERKHHRKVAEYDYDGFKLDRDDIEEDDFEEKFFATV